MPKKVECPGCGLKFKRSEMEWCDRSGIEMCNNCCEVVHFDACEKCGDEYPEEMLIFISAYSIYVCEKCEEILRKEWVRTK